MRPGLESEVAGPVVEIGGHARWCCVEPGETKDGTGWMVNGGEGQGWQRSGSDLEYGSRRGSLKRSCKKYRSMLQNTKRLLIRRDIEDNLYSKASALWRILYSSFEFSPGAKV